MIYASKLSEFTQKGKELKAKFDGISMFRVLVALIFVFMSYVIYKSGFNILYLVIMLLLVVSYLFLLKWHEKVRWERKFVEAKKEINEDELGFLNDGSKPFYNGKDFIQDDHDYSYDLDFYGENSFYHYLNRAYTFIGRKTLAENLGIRLDRDQILKTQDAVKELSNDLNWRQDFTAYGKIIDDNKTDYNNLLKWGALEVPRVPKWLRILGYISPALLLLSALMFWITSVEIYYNICVYLFIINLGMIGSQMKKISKELNDSDKLEAILKNYGLLLKHIEDKKFENTKLEDLRSKLIVNGNNSNEAIRQLSSLFTSLNNITNVMGSIIVNGLFVGHLHTYDNLMKWRQDYGLEFKSWLSVIGEFESILSISNFAYNNADFVFPTIDESDAISFKNLGHPLIAQSKRVCNDVTFDEQGFIILTGSNMSGKSTFLRTMGINMVLTGIGSPVCASEAIVHPKRVIVSMRLSDSLNDDESYFYAEVKRLKYILDALDGEKCFILLDEILRGTNSEDKQYGTIEVIKRIAATESLGAIATHDLEVCNIVDDYEDRLTNKCFEVEIINDELAFDYKLRDGVCSSKNASFLMRKMGVI